MSTLDRLGNYKASIGYVPKDKKVTDGVFDLNTPEGVFLHLVHSKGFKMYDEDGNFTELHKVLTTNGNQKIQAIAGSGKTTSLIFKIMHDICTGEIMRNQSLPNGNVVRVVDKVFVGTFLKSGADELRKSLTDWQTALGYTITASQINFGTLHAEFKRCLNAMGVATPIGSIQVISNLLKKAVNACNIKRDGNDLLQDDYKIIESVLMYYRGRLDEKRYQHPSALEYGLTPSILDLLNRQFSQYKVAEGVMDFEDLQELLYKFLYITPNPNVQDFVANRYNYIYLDEFQDTSQIQYEILKMYARGCKKDTDTPTKSKIIVVGDVEQCIYSFRGSCIEVMHKMFDEDFESTKNKLSYNYRCPSKILEPIVSSINLNPEAKGIDIKAVKEGGIFGAYSFVGLTPMLTHLKDSIEEDMNSGMDLAILCRTNYDGMIPAIFLEMSGKYNFSITSDAMTLNSALPRRMLKVGKLFTEKSTPAIKDVLTMFVPRYDHYKVRKVADVLKMNKLSIWDMDERDLKWGCESLYDTIMMFKSIRKKYNNDDVKTLNYIYYWLRVNTFSADSAYCEGARACIDVLRFFINSKEFTSVYDFLDEADYLNEKLTARIGKKSKISVATVHEFKGKERDSIVVWNDSDGVFPSSKIDVENIDQLSEERRVHYIACTRARKKCSIYTRAGKVGMFLDEMDTEIKPCEVQVQKKMNELKSQSNTAI